MNDRDTLMRRALWATSVFNLVGATAFAFPASAFGRLAGLPPVVPVAYRTVTALFVLLFGGVYVWLARRPVIDRPMVAFAAIGKASVSLLVLLLWIFSDMPGHSVVVFSGDLAFAAVFAWWLAAPASSRS